MPREVDIETAFEFNGFFFTKRVRKEFISKIIALTTKVEGPERKKNAFSVEGSIFPRSPCSLRIQESLGEGD